MINKAAGHGTGVIDWPIGPPSARQKGDVFLGLALLPSAGQVDR